MQKYKQSSPQLCIEGIIQDLGSLDSLSGELQSRLRGPYYGDKFINNSSLFKWEDPFFSKNKADEGNKNNWKDTIDKNSKIGHFT